MKIVYQPTGELIARGKRGWPITPFEGNFYISSKSLMTRGFKTNFIPGVCPYKFLYVWLDYFGGDGNVVRNLGWRYWLPNPLLPFIWFRVAVSQDHPDLMVLEE